MLVMSSKFVKIWNVFKICQALVITEPFVVHYHNHNHKYVTGRYWRRINRSDRAGELSAHGPGEDRTAGVRKTTGPVFEYRHPHKKAFPHASRRRTMDAVTLHGKNNYIYDFLLYFF